MTQTRIRVNPEEFNNREGGRTIVVNNYYHKVKK